MTIKPAADIDNDLTEPVDASERDRRKSISRRIADSSSVPTQEQPHEPMPPAPLVESLRGVLEDPGSDLGAYRRHLREKHA